MNKYNLASLKAPSISITELHESSVKCAQLLKNENLNINDLTLQSLIDKVKHFAQTEVIVLNADESAFVMVTNERTHRLLAIYAQAVMIFLDTYTIVLLAMERLCGTNKVTRFNILVNELHVSIKSLFEQKVVKYLHSSLQDNIQSCLYSLSQRKLISINTYANKSEVSSEFIVVPEENRDRIKETISYLTTVRHVSQIHTKMIEDANLMVIERVKLAFPFFAQL